MTVANVYVPTPTGTDVVDWRANLDEVLRNPGLIRPAFQPIYDLSRSRACGYEALARFPLEPQRSPISWLEAAKQLQLRDRFEAALLDAGLRARGALPLNCFLTVNVSPAALLSDPVQGVLERAGRLDALVVELTEREAVEDYVALGAAIETLRSSGATIAVDDAGAGYASLQHIMSLRPEFIKLDRALVSGLDTDPAKLALVEAVGSFAARIDAWVIAEGIEHRAELDAVRSISVPLGQGYGLGIPAPAMAGAELEPHLRCPTPPVDSPADLATILSHPAPLLHSQLALAGERFAEEPSTEFLVVLDDRRRPIGLLRRDTRVEDVDAVLIAPLRVMISEAPDAVARRAMTRPFGQRFDPIIACDERGRYTGMLATDQLVHLLSRIVSQGPR